jgi:hypothetical protein
VERLKPTKRRKVVPDPNTIFADIANIRRAQEEAGRFDSEPSESETTSESELEEEEVLEEIVVVR